MFSDPHQIQQVLLNLIINAEQAMLGAHGRGTLIVRTWHDADRDAVVLEVNDDGPGVPEEVQPRIFDPFFTTKEVGKGTGLGLTVAYAIVQEHGGRITREIRAGPWRIVLRRDAGGRRPAQARAAASAGAGGIRTRRGRGRRRAGRRGRGGARRRGRRSAWRCRVLVDRASDGLEALERLKERRYDLIVCDLKMPRLDGTAFYRQLETDRRRDGPAGAVRHRRCGGHRGGTVSRGDRLPLARQAVSVEGSAAGGPGNGGVSLRRDESIRDA